MVDLRRQRGRPVDSTAVVMLDDMHTLAEERGVKFGIVELHRDPLEIWNVRASRPRSAPT